MVQAQWGLEAEKTVEELELKNIIDVVSGFLSCHYFRSGLQEYPFNVVEDITKKVDEDTIKKINYQSQFDEWRFKQLDALFGQFPIKIKIEDNDLIKTGNEPLEMQVSRFIAAQSIMLSLIGMPGIYFHSLFGSRGWLEGVQQTRRNRTINREKLQFDELQNQLADENSLRSKVFAKYSELLKTRSTSSAFDPHGTQKIIDLHPSVFAVERTSPDGKARVLCLHNVSQKPVSDFWGLS